MSAITPHHATPHEETVPETGPRLPPQWFMRGGDERDRLWA